MACHMWTRPHCLSLLLGMAGMERRDYSIAQPVAVAVLPAWQMLSMPVPVPEMELWSHEYRKDAVGSFYQVATRWHMQQMSTKGVLFLSEHSSCLAFLSAVSSPPALSSQALSCPAWQRPRQSMGRAHTCGRPAVKGGRKYTCLEWVSTTEVLPEAHSLSAFMFAGICCATRIISARGMM